MQGDKLTRAVLGLLCLAGFTALFWGQRDRVLSGANDFVPLYVAATEVGGASLYDPNAYYAFQQAHFGGYAEALIYSRPPYYALLLKPLAWLSSFEAAYLGFGLLRGAAIACFLLLWPREQLADAALFLCLSFPLFASLANGQDVVFLLPLIALALHLERSGKPFWAGVAFALCANKFHLLILLPAALIAQRRWGVIRGLAAGAAALLGLSFVAGGWTWPSDYANVLLLGKLHPEPHIMPNLHGLLAGLPAATAWEIAGGMAAIAAVAYAARRGDFAFGLAAASVGSLIVSRHCYVSDLTILLPGLLATARSLTTPLAKFLALSWLSPILPLILVTGRPLSYAAQAALPLALAAYVISGMKSSSQAEEPAPAVADVAV